MLTIDLPVEIEDRLEALVRQTGQTKTFLAREAILEHLDDLEDFYIAERRLLANQSGESYSIPIEEVMRSYGLED